MKKINLYQKSMISILMVLIVICSNISYGSVISVVINRIRDILTSAPDIIPGNSDALFYYIGGGFYPGGASTFYYPSQWVAGFGPGFDSVYYLDRYTSPPSICKAIYDDGNSTGWALAFNWMDPGFPDRPDASIVVDLSDNVYTCNYGLIKKYNSSLTYLGQFGSFGTGNGQFADAFLTIGVAGKIYVADMHNSNRIQIFNADFSWNKTVTFNYNIMGLTSDYYGKIYILTNNNTIAKYDSELVLISETSPLDQTVISISCKTLAHTIGDELTDPIRIVVPLLDEYAYYVYNQHLAFLGKFETKIVEISQLQKSIVLAGKKHVYSRPYFPSGQFNHVSTHDYLEKGIPDIDVSKPLGMGRDNLNNGYVVTTGNRLLKFNANNTLLATYGVTGTGNGELLSPQDVAIDKDNCIYITDNNSRVQKFNSSFTYLGQFGGFGSGNGKFNDPRGIVIDSDGNIYVADANNNRVQKFNKHLRYTAKFGSTGSGNGQFLFPTDVEIDSTGNIFVADYSNNRVQKFLPSMTFNFTISSHSNPYSVVCDAVGNVYVIGSNRIRKYRQINGFLLSVLGTSNPGSTDFLFDNPKDIIIFKAADQYDLYWGQFSVSDYGNNRIRNFQPYIPPSY
jgi:sugar lactone lactonase YvrE